MSKTSWMSIAFDSWTLGMEASTVIGLRLSKMALMDPAAMVEAQLMIGEKIEATAQLQMKAMTGGLGSTAHSAARTSLAHYRKAVRKNRRRLSSGK